jgi:hypothetical protein
MAAEAYPVVGLLELHLGVTARRCVVTAPDRRGTMG